jgi:hypothetical protein
VQTTSDNTNSVEYLFGKDELISGTPQEILVSLGRFGILNLGYDGERGSNPGYIFRGEADFDCPLQCSIERDWRYDQATAGTLSNERLKAMEKALLENFLKSEGPRLASIVDQQIEQKSWDDVWWWLSLMQHYDRRTRLIDFTRDIRLALYFAIEQHERRLKRKREFLDLVIYCFSCRDLKHPHNLESNKCPFRPTPLCKGVDMNLVIGLQLGLSWMDPHKNWMSSDEPEKYFARTEQSWGWDRPYYQNPRIRVQKGMFVYPYAYPRSPLEKADHSSWFVQNLRLSAKSRTIPST